MSTKRSLVTQSALIALALSLVAAMLALPGWLAAALGALAVLPLWQALRSHEDALKNCLADAAESFAQSAHAMLLLDAQGHAIAANSAFKTLALLDAAQAPATLCAALPESWQAFISGVHAEALALHTTSTKALLPRSATTSALMQAHALRLPSIDGAQQILLLWENLSANNEKLDQLLEREKRLLERSRAFVQTLIDVIPQPVYIKHIEGINSRYALVNKAFCSTHNCGRAELIGITTLELFKDPVRAAMINQEDLRVLDGLPVFREEQSLDTQTGQDRFTFVSKQACEDAEGQTVIVGSNIDITPWRMAERNLRLALQREVDRREQVQAFVQRLIDVIPHPVHVKDSESHYLMLNEAFMKERGRTREELLGKNPIQVVGLNANETPDAQDNERSRALLSLEEDRRILAGGTLIKEEHNYHSVTGAERFRTVHKAGCLDAEGHPVIVSAFFDVTPWRLAERELNETLMRERNLLSRTRLFNQRMIDLIPEEFYVKDADSRFVLANRAFMKRRNLTDMSQVIGRSMDEVSETMCRADPQYANNPEALAGAIADHHARSERARLEDLKVLAGHSVFKEDHNILPHSGEERYFLVAKTACEDAEGKPVIVCANFNLTALRLTERALREKEASINSEG